MLSLSWKRGNEKSDVGSPRRRACLRPAKQFSYCRRSLNSDIQNAENFEVVPFFISEVLTVYDVINIHIDYRPGVPGKSLKNMARSRGRS